jgi:hypothetical protein
MICPALIFIFIFLYVGVPRPAKGTRSTRGPGQVVKLELQPVLSPFIEPWEFGRCCEEIFDCECSPGCSRSVASLSTIVGSQQYNAMGHQKNEVHRCTMNCKNGIELHRCTHRQACFNIHSRTRTKDDNNSIGKPGDQLRIPEGFAREEYWTPREFEH